MYGDYNRGMMYGIGQPSAAALQAAAENFRPNPAPGFPYAFQGPDGKIVYTTPEGAKVLRAAGAHQLSGPWYADPLILGGIAVVAGIVLVGALR
jgi:hypothetical protein